MAIFKCKMCGGALEINNETVATCEYCGTQQTLPKLDDEKRAQMYDRANHFRRNNEFDKAMGIYEQILNEDNSDSEAYWSLVLCRYGIEYVEDPSSHKRIPTVNRAQFTSIFDDDNYKSAIEYADGYQKSIYEEEAKVINEIQKGILEISQKEEPFDVFICYKETDNSGRRTHDSVLANDLYHQLKQEGFKVFFARITLEDKLGSAYEPYIFAALNSSKVMVVLGTKPEFFNAVWVKNEWSRYLALIKNGANKMLIPAYKDMDPYDLPEEFSHLQAQDMSKLGFMQDLIRGIKKIVSADEPKTIIKETVVASAPASNIAPLLERAFMFLEDGEWDSATEYCERVLDIDPKCAEAYLGKLMVDLKVKKRVDLARLTDPFDSKSNYVKLMRFADSELKAEVEEYLCKVQEEFKLIKAAALYNDARNALQKAKTKEDFFVVSELFKSLGDFEDSQHLYEECILRGNNTEKNNIYAKAKKIIETATTESKLDLAINLLRGISGYMDADSLAEECKLTFGKDFEQYNLLVTEFKVLSQGKTSAERTQQLKEKIYRLTDEKTKLECLLKSLPEDRKELETAENEQKSKKDKIGSLRTERASLGIFSGRRKKEIDENIYILEKNLEVLNEKVAGLKRKLSSYSSVEAISKKIVSIEADIQKSETEFAEMEDKVTSSLSEEDIIRGLLSENIFKFVLGNQDILNELLEHPLTMEITNNENFVDWCSGLYGVKLPQDIIDKIEGTDDLLYFINKKDNRTETQIVADFEKHFENEYIAEYKIERDIEAAYFDEHPKCKPIQFLFRKEEKDVLAVAVVKYSSIKHPAVKNMKIACEHRGIPYIHFIVGYPNKEHYVVRRVLEELGEIDCVNQKAKIKINPITGKKFTVYK